MASAVGSMGREKLRALKEQLSRNSESSFVAEGSFLKQGGLSKKTLKQIKRLGKRQLEVKLEVNQESDSEEKMLLECGQKLLQLFVQKTHYEYGELIGKLVSNFNAQTRFVDAEEVQAKLTRLRELAPNWFSIAKDRNLGLVVQKNASNFNFALLKQLVSAH